MRGRVPDEDWRAAAEVVVVPAVVLETEPLAGNAADGVEPCGEGVGEELALPDDVVLDEDVEECELDPLEPPSGSTYCWSPAEEPDASAATGPNRAIAASTESHAVMRQNRTARVLQAVKPLASAPVPGREAKIGPTRAVSLGPEGSFFELRR